MDDYMIWLAFPALAIFALSMIYLGRRNCKALQADNVRLYSELDMMRSRLREREVYIDRVQRNSDNLLKWKNRATELEEELKETKKTEKYASASRLEHLEGLFQSPSGKNQNQSIRFLQTFPPRGCYTIEDKLLIMMENAKFEVVIVSPWIKRQMWERIRGPLKKFARRGGRLQVR